MTNTHHHHQSDQPTPGFDRRTSEQHSDGHGDHGSSHSEHGANGGHDKHAGHSPAMFRDRFWLSFVLTIPVVFYSTMVQEWFGYTAPSFQGSDWIAPVLGTSIFVYGGTPFLKGAVGEARDRQPGMMLLIGMAISVAFVASRSCCSVTGWRCEPSNRPVERSPRSPNSCPMKPSGSSTAGYRR